MQTDNLEKSREHFARDLRILRENKQVSLDTIHTETRIIKSILREFEKNCLYNNSNFQRIYLRSLTKSYASVIGLDVNKILIALDLALEGKYDGNLNPNHSPKRSHSTKPRVKK